MTFLEYYRGGFSDDLDAILRHAKYDHGFPEPALQPRHLSDDNPLITEWRSDQRRKFAAALFLTVLSDQVCYTYFPDSYEVFRRLTNYPKFRGDCPGGCSSNIHPSLVFVAISQPIATYSSDRFDYHMLPADTVTTMQSEVQHFVDVHMPQLGREFWARCQAEMPPRLIKGMQPERRPPHYGRRTL